MYTFILSTVLYVYFHPNYSFLCILCMYTLYVYTFICICETSHVTSNYNKYGARLERTFRQLNLPASAPNRPKVSDIGNEKQSLPTKIS